MDDLELDLPVLFADDADLSWQDEALCNQTDPEAWFPEKGGSTREAKKVCASCPVAAECLDYALAHNERFGIWGGLSERERRKVRLAMEVPDVANGHDSKTHCDAGHAFTDENTYERPSGGRTCRKCQNAAAQAYKQKKKHEKGTAA